SLPRGSGVHRPVPRLFRGPVAARLIGAAIRSPRWAARTRSGSPALVVFLSLIIPPSAPSRFPKSRATNWFRFLLSPPYGAPSSSFPENLVILLGRTSLQEYYCNNLTLD